MSTWSWVFERKHFGLPNVLKRVWIFSKNNSSSVPVFREKWQELRRFLKLDFFLFGLNSCEVAKAMHYDTRIHIEKMLNMYFTAPIWFQIFSFVYNKEFINRMNSKINTALLGHGHLFNPISQSYWIWKIFYIRFIIMKQLWLRTYWASFQLRNRDLRFNNTRENLSPEIVLI